MNRPVILASGTPQILLPWDNAEIFERNLLSSGDRQLASWTAWTAPRTMKVDEAAQQVKMPAAELRAANNIPAGMLLKAGSTLLVHRKGALDNDVHESTADNAQLILAPEVVLRRVRVKARKGDTLASLGARHGVSAASLASWNRLSASAALKQGQTLDILIPSKATRSSPPTARQDKRRPTAKTTAAPARKPLAQTAAQRTR